MIWFRFARPRLCLSSCPFFLLLFPERHSQPGKDAPVLPSVCTVGTAFSLPGVREARDTPPFLTFGTRVNETVLPSVRDDQAGFNTPYYLGGSNHALYCFPLW